VVIEVEVGVVDPDRPALAEGDEAQLLAEARNQVQALGDVVAEFPVGRRFAPEDADGGDVHVGAGALQVEEGGVQAAESFGLRHWDMVAQVSSPDASDASRLGSQISRNIAVFAFCEFCVRLLTFAL
jgi:hypothetical protein